MKSATLFCVVGALSVGGAGCAISWRIVLPSVRAVGAHTAVSDWLISCSHFLYIDNCVIFYGFRNRIRKVEGNTGKQYNLQGNTNQALRAVMFSQQFD
jgi:hypothetical protein